MKSTDIELRSLINTPVIMKQPQRTPLLDKSSNKMKENFGAINRKLDLNSNSSHEDDNWDVPLTKQTPQKLRKVSEE